MLLDVEHFHSTVNFKSNLQTMLTTSVKESCKGITKWVPIITREGKGGTPLLKTVCISQK